MDNKQIQDYSLSLLEELLKIASPSGREEKMADYVRQSLEKMGYSPETDGAGNVIVRLPGIDASASTCTFAAHMDEIGVVVTHIYDDGTLGVAPSGGLFPSKIGERPLRIIGDKEEITAVLSFGTGHTANFDGNVAWKDVRAITGYSKQQLEERGIRPGSTGVPVSEGRGPFLLGDANDPLLAAWIQDDRLGVVIQLIVLRLLKEKSLQPRHPVTVAFTIHEEGGCHGAKILAHREKPDIFISIDGFPWVPDAGVEVNDRPTCASMDDMSHYDQRLIKNFAEAAQLAGTKLQTMVLSNAYCDASAVYNSGGAPRIGFIGYTRYNSHGFEVSRLSVIPHIVATVLEFMQMSL
jgi:putative aminopeptidase FrvX